MKLIAALALGMLLFAGAGAAYAHEEDLPSDVRSAPRLGLVFHGLTAARPNGPCGEGFEVRLPDNRTGCTHGPDPAPPGRDVRKPRDLGDITALSTGNPSGDPATGPSDVVCVGDGVDGNRVQAVYAYPADGADNYEAIAPYIRQWAAQADRIFNTSASETGGVRHIRYVTDVGCQVDVAKVALSPEGVESLAGTAADLRAQGLDRPDRKYVVWVDAYVYCGIASVEPDDRPGQNNANNGNGQPGMIGRIDRGCWGIPGDSAEAHELTHILGGVQPTAPHGTWNYHCSDESELMCYDDDDTADGFVGSHGVLVPLTYSCPKAHERLLDCNHDDYFSTSPSPDTWLGQHWNVADSSFLTSEGPPAPRDTIAPRPTRPALIVEGQLRRKVPVRLTWGSRDPDVAGYWVWRSIDGHRWRYVPRRELWSNTATVRLRRGHSYRFLVHAFDEAGNASPAALGQPFSARVFQERSRAVSYRGRWAHVYRAEASAKHVSVARGSVVRSQLVFYGKAIAWVSPKSPEGGTAAVFVDGRYLATIDLASPESLERQVVLYHRFARRRWHRIAIRPHVRPSGVPIDAFIVVR
jgi:hypothetical protein